MVFKLLEGKRMQRYQAIKIICHKCDDYIEIGCFSEHVAECKLPKCEFKTCAKKAKFLKKGKLFCSFKCFLEMNHPEQKD